MAILSISREYQNGSPETARAVAIRLRVAGKKIR